MRTVGSARLFVRRGPSAFHDSVRIRLLSSFMETISGIQDCLLLFVVTKRRPNRRALAATTMTITIAGR